MLILGVDLSKYTFGRALRAEDCEPILLKPMITSNAQEVRKALNEAWLKSGVPLQLCIDGGSDLAAGCTLFQNDCPETSVTRDVAHKVANLLKSRLEHSNSWKKLTTLITEIKSKLQQTDFAYLVPPSQRTKSRFMNIETIVHWSQKMLCALKTGNLLQTAPKYLSSLLSKLLDMEKAINHFVSLDRISSLARLFTRERGMCIRTTDQLEECLSLQNLDLDACDFAGKVLDFIHQQAQMVPKEEVLIASTEIIESTFGRYKFLQGDRSCFGTTNLSLYLGSCVGNIDSSLVRSALTSISEKCINDWSDQFLGETLLQARRKFFHEPKVQKMEDEQECISESVLEVLFA